MKNTIITATIWLGCGFLASGFACADFEHCLDFTDGPQPSAFACSKYRQDLGAATGIGLILGPVALAISPFVTGFYPHGWTLRPRPDCISASK